LRLLFSVLVIVNPELVQVVRLGSPARAAAGQRPAVERTVHKLLQHVLRGDRPEQPHQERQ
jgi:hypothetical protein